jgi:hypothetical protein
MSLSCGDDGDMREDAGGSTMDAAPDSDGGAGDAGGQADANGEADAGTTGMVIDGVVIEGSFTP